MRYLFILLITIGLQSCFTMRNTFVEPELKRDYKGATVDDVEFAFGAPDRDEDLRNGYAYTYYNQNPSNHRAAEQFTRFAFDNDGYVRNVQSNKTERRRKFDAGGTVLVCVLIFVVVPTVILLAFENAGTE